MRKIGRWYDRLTFGFVGWAATGRYRKYIVLPLLIALVTFLLVLGSLAAGRPLSR